MLSTRHKQGIKEDGGYTAGRPHDGQCSALHSREYPEEGLS